MAYAHLTHEDRASLALLRRLGHSLRSIARALGKHHTTIGRELERNAKENKSGYDARHARLLSHERRVHAHRQRRTLLRAPSVRRYVIRKLKLYWSPEQIAGRLRLRHGRTIVCHETIYRWIERDRPDQAQFLRCRKGKYRRRHGSKQRKKMREAEEKKRRVDARPAIVETRERIGDLEGDTIVGKDQDARILTHVERRSGLVLADKVDETKAECIRALAVQRLQTLPPDKRHTVTYDNGWEFSEHERIEREAGVTVYFAYPYHSWERGTNENTNGLLRQFFPKGTPFSGIRQEEIDRAVFLLNTRPRKRHGYRTPEEVFHEKRCSSG